MNKAIVCVLQVLWRADARSTAYAERVALCTRCSVCMLDLGHGAYGWCHAGHMQRSLQASAESGIAILVPFVSVHRVHIDVMQE